MTDGPDAAPPGKVAGCLLAAVAFVVISLLGWFVVMAAYVFLVEHWRVITVRREFGYDMALIFAPIFALVGGGLAAWWITQQQSRPRLIIVAALAAVGALLLMLALFGFGMFY